jgi:hypothetical protein
MKLRRMLSLLAASLLVIPPLAAQPSPLHAARPALRDGSHDFDFERGAWKIHIRRLLHPLTGSNEWVEYDGVKTDMLIWSGKANIAEVKADGPEGHLDFVALRLYDPAAHQWSLNFASKGSGAFGAPLYGEMRDGHMEFIGSDTANERNILVRFILRSDGPGKASSEQYFSGDGGRSWELNWINAYTLMKG